MKFSKGILGAALVAVFLNATATPLTVENGLFVQNGKPFYGVGVNYFDGFTRYAKNKKDESWKIGLRVLKEHNIPFVRISTIGFWPETIQSDYLKDEATKQEFHKRLKDFMDEADRLEIGVILDVFWNWTALVSINNEHASAIGNSSSRTRTMMKEIINDMVDHHKDHPALWGWEFTNEGSNVMDLVTTRGYHNYACLPVRQGLPLEWTESDDFTYADMISAIKFFAETVREKDKRTPVFGGNNVPRKNAYHMRYRPLGETYTQDSAEEFGLILSKNDPDPVNTLSMHLYPEQEGEYFRGKGSQIADILDAAMNRSRYEKRPFYLGEFGGSEKSGAYVASEKISQFLDAIYDKGIQLSSFWVYDFAYQKDTYGIMAQNESKEYLKKLKQINLDMRSRTEVPYTNAPSGLAEAPQEVLASWPPTWKVLTPCKVQ